MAENRNSGQRAALHYQAAKADHSARARAQVRSDRVCGAHKVECHLDVMHRGLLELKGHSRISHFREGNPVGAVLYDARGRRGAGLRRPKRMPRRARKGNAAAMHDTGLNQQA